MGRTLWHVTMSLDGFIAGPDDSMDWAFKASSGPNEIAADVRENTGAILAGRRWYDVAGEKYDGVDGIYGGAWSGPVFVLTHRPDEVPDDPTVAFLSDGLEHAVMTARNSAGNGNLEIFGANLAGQCLADGHIDEIVVHLAPVLLGDGVRLYAGDGRVDLERTTIEESDHLLSMRFDVRR
jgi:dihydrofolate reductase